MNEKQICEKRNRPKHPDNRVNEFWFEWKWKRFGDTPTNEEMKSDRYEMECEAEFETDADLNKSIPQLVCDFNFESELALAKCIPMETKLLLKAQSRMVAMMAQVAMKNEKVSDKISRLNLFIVIIGLMTFGFIVFSYFYPCLSR